MEGPPPRGPRTTGRSSLQIEFGVFTHAVTLAGHEVRLISFMFFRVWTMVRPARELLGCAVRIRFRPVRRAPAKPGSCHVPPSRNCVGQLIVARDPQAASPQPQTPLPLMNGRIASFIATLAITIFCQPGL